MDAEMKLKMIQDIMDGLQSEMEYGEDDFNERLGRKKPDVAVEIEAKGEMPEEMMGDEFPMEDEEMETPDSKLKARLLKMRG
jgi:hypothetical protein